MIIKATLALDYQYIDASDQGEVADQPYHPVLLTLPFLHQLAKKLPSLGCERRMADSHPIFGHFYDDEATAAAALEAAIAAFNAPTTSAEGLKRHNELLEVRVL